MEAYDDDELLQQLKTRKLPYFLLDAIQPYNVVHASIALQTAIGASVNGMPLLQSDKKAGRFSHTQQGYQRKAEPTLLQGIETSGLMRAAAPTLNKISHALRCCSSATASVILGPKDSPNEVFLQFQPVSLAEDTCCITHYLASVQEQETPESELLAMVDLMGELSGSTSPTSTLDPLQDVHANIVTDCMAADDATVIALFAAQRALVKTVKNDDWLVLIHSLATGAPFRTSLSLPPAGGSGMTLFGRVSSGCVGLIWDSETVDLSKAFCWPSGYYAKTEHNMRPDGKGGYFLLGGREDALVTPEALRQANDAHMASAACSIVDSAAESTAEGAVEVGGEQSSTSSPLSYNEISTDLCGIRGIRAIFVRAAKRESVLLAMGIRSLIQHCFPWLLPLPLMLLTPQSGALPIPRRTQLAVLRAVSKSCVDAGGADSPAVCGLPVEPRIPVDVAEFPELSLKETLRLHARYGVSKSSLDALFRDVVSSSTNAPQALARCSSTAIADAIANNNAASAREVVRSAAPLMVRAASVAVAVARSEPEPSAALTPSELIKLGTAVPHRLYAELGEMQLAEENSGVESDTALAACAAPLARSVHASRDALVALGAQVMLREFVAGKVAPRLRAACDQLGAWLTQAQQPSCGALLFLVRSWREICKVEPDSQLTTFLSGKAVVNRARFRAELQRLRDAKDGLQYISMLYELVSRLHRPCLRLRVLQQVLGLDERFSREIVFGVVCLAHDIVDRMETPEANALDAANVDQCCGCYGSNVEMGRRASYPEAGATPNCGGQVQLQRSRTLPAVLAPPQDRTSLTNLIDFDEAIHLEAEIILGPTSVKSHTSDPLGDEWRRYRMLSGFRH